MARPNFVSKGSIISMPIYMDFMIRLKHLSVFQHFMTEIILFYAKSDDKYLWNVLYMPGTVVGTRNVSANKTENNIA